MMVECDYFSAACPSRQLFDQVTDKWSMMVLSVIRAKPLRFNTIRRHVEGVTQKALTQTLRRLERNGLVVRRVLPTSPVAVEYAITDLGLSLQGPLGALHEWTITNLDKVAEAQRAYEA